MNDYKKLIDEIKPMTAASSKYLQSLSAIIDDKIKFQEAKEKDYSCFSNIDLKEYKNALEKIATDIAVNIHALSEASKFTNNSVLSVDDRLRYKAMAHKIEQYKSKFGLI